MVSRIAQTFFSLARTVAFGVTLAAVSVAQSADTIRVVEVLNVALPDSSPPSGTTHALRLSVYHFQGTRWRSDALRSAVIESAQLIAQCRVALTALELRVLETPRRFHFYSTPVSRELLRAIAVSKPGIFFVEDTHNRPAFDAEAIGLGNAGPRPELANTIWVAYGARDLSYALAHELVHVLSDSGEHSTKSGNLMQPETSPRNASLTETQCERLRSRGVVNGLLEQR